MKDSPWSSPARLGVASTVASGVALLVLLSGSVFASPATAIESTAVVRAPAVATAVLAATSVSAPVTTTAPAGDAAAAPQLSIAVDDGKTATAEGDSLTYTVTVRNLGTTPVTGLHVTQSVPTGLTFGSADTAGVAKPGTVEWTVDLAATSEAVVHTTMTVAATPAELLRLATVACANQTSTSPPIVCASDSDQLPAGAAAGTVPPSATDAGLAPTESERSPGVLIGGLVGAALLVGILVVWLTRRPRRGV